MEVKIELPEVHFSDGVVEFTSEETEKMLELREGVDYFKSLLDGKVIPDRNHFLSKVNPFYYVKYEIEKKVNPKKKTNNYNSRNKYEKTESEPCRVNINWLKTYEIICKYNIFNKDKEKYIFFDVAALPGHNIFACEYHVKTVLNKEFDFFGTGSAFNDYQQDTFKILENDRKSGINRWLMGGTAADPSSIEFINFLSDKVVKMQISIDFFFGDFSVDLSSDFQRQEELFMPYITGEIMIALRNMRHGSSMCLKQYSLFTNYSISYICALSQMFEEFYLYKPTPSKQQNSEIFLVGINYKHSGFMCKDNQETCCARNNCAPMRTLYKKLKECLQSRVYNPVVDEKTIDSFINKYFEPVESIYKKHMEKIGDIISVIESDGFARLDRKTQLDMAKKKNSTEVVEQFHRICGLR